MFNVEEDGGRVGAPAGGKEKKKKKILGKIGITHHF